MSRGPVPGRLMNNRSSRRVTVGVGKWDAADGKFCPGYSAEFVEMLNGLVVCFSSDFMSVPLRSVLQVVASRRRTRRSLGMIQTTQNRRTCRHRDARSDTEVVVAGATTLPDHSRPPRVSGGLSCLRRGRTSDQVTGLVLSLAHVVRTENRAFPPRSPTGSRRSPPDS